MAKTPAPAGPVVPPAKIDIIGGILSYLIPGLGQISQGRVGKGLLFFVCLHGLFFYGMFLGQWENVYLPNRPANLQEGGFKRFRSGVGERIQIVGQVGIGVSAWPALYHFYRAGEGAKPREYLPGEIRSPGLDEFQKEPPIEKLNDIQRAFSREWDLGLVYTVIAGVLNLLVIYDAVAGPAFREVPASRLLPPPVAGPSSAPLPVPAGDPQSIPGRPQPPPSEAPPHPAPPGS